MFDITVLEGEHSRLYSDLTQDHSQLDSNFMSVEIQNIVRVYPSVTVSMLVEIIKQQYRYNVKDRWVWEVREKLYLLFFWWSGEIIQRASILVECRCTL